MVAFQAWMVETRSASTALSKYMDRLRPPKTPTKLVPVLGEADTAKVLQACRGKGFVILRAVGKGNSRRPSTEPRPPNGLCSVKPTQDSRSPRFRAATACSPPDDPPTRRRRAEYAAGSGVLTANRCFLAWSGYELGHDFTVDTGPLTEPRRPRVNPYVCSELTSSLVHTVAASGSLVLRMDGPRESHLSACGPG